VLSDKNNIQFVAYDKDPLSSEFLGSSTNISLVSLVENENKKMHELELYDKNHKKSGSLNIITQFEAVPNNYEINPDMNSNSYVLLHILEATFLKEGSLLDKNDPFLKFKYNDEYL